MTPGNGADAIDQAIASTEERTIRMGQVPVTLASSGRPVILHVPVDMDDVEIIELAAFLLIHMRPWIAKMQDGSAGLWTPGT